MAKNHYVSQLIIKRFAPSVSTFDMQTNQIVEHRQAAKIFFDRDIYDNDIEEKMAHDLEQPIASLLDKKIIDCDVIRLTRKELNLLKRFLLLDSVRTYTPEHFQHVISNFYSNTQRYLKAPGQKVKLYTHFAVREDGVELFGFYDLEERDTFKLLSTVSGVGPKAAINIMSALTPESFAVAVMNGDTKLISKAQNVGAKTAARIVLELKDKIGKTVSVQGGEEILTSVNTASSSEKVSEAQNALMVLGYKQSEAVAALRGIDVNKYDLEDIIREALKKLMR